MYPADIDQNSPIVKMTREIAKTLDEWENEMASLYLSPVSQFVLFNQKNTDPKIAKTFLWSAFVSCYGSAICSLLCSVVPPEKRQEAAEFSEKLLFQAIEDCKAKIIQIREETDPSLN